MSLYPQNKSLNTKHPFGIGQGLFYLLVSMLADVKAGKQLTPKGGLFVIEGQVLWTYCENGGVIYMHCTVVSQASAQCTEFQGVKIAASIQMYGSCIWVSAHTG